jgi:hypothetical protein
VGNQTLPWSDVRQALKKDVRKAIEPLIASGWTITRGGHGYYLHCPCPSENVRIPVYTTPKSPTFHALVISRQAAHCPDRHDLLHGGVSR